MLSSDVNFDSFAFRVSFHALLHAVCLHAEAKCCTHAMCNMHHSFIHKGAAVIVLITPSGQTHTEFNHVTWHIYVSYINARRCCAVAPPLDHTNLCSFHVSPDEKCLILLPCNASSLPCPFLNHSSQRLEQLNQYPDFNNYLIFVLTKLKSEGKLSFFAWPFQFAFRMLVHSSDVSFLFRGSVTGLLGHDSSDHCLLQMMWRSEYGSL